jgi:hypothetical protein
MNGSHAAFGAAENSPEDMAQRRTLAAAGKKETVRARAQLRFKLIDPSFELFGSLGLKDIFIAH